MIVLPAAEFKARLSEYLKACENELVVVTRKGRPMAVLLSLTDDEVEDLILARSPKMRPILDKSWADIQAVLGISHDDFWQEFASEKELPVYKKNCPFDLTWM